MCFFVKGLIFLIPFSLLFFFLSREIESLREKEREFLIRVREIPNENFYIPRLCLFFLAIYRIHSICLCAEQREEQNREKTLNAFVLSRWLVRGERERKKQSYSSRRKLDTERQPLKLIGKRTNIDIKSHQNVLQTSL